MGDVNNDHDKERIAPWITVGIGCQNECSKVAEGFMSMLIARLEEREGPST